MMDWEWWVSINKVCVLNMDNGYWNKAFAAQWIGLQRGIIMHIFEINWKINNSPFIKHDSWYEKGKQSYEQATSMYYFKTI